jgi:hypothetical protein
MDAAYAAQARRPVERQISPAIMHSRPGNIEQFSRNQASISQIENASIVSD